MKEFLQKVGCLLIGWDLSVLKQCGESSYRTFRKLVSAIIIVMILWGIIGFSFAQRYLNIQSIIGSLFVAIVFMTIVLCIERIIILKDGGAKWIYVFRILIAICMAILGSFIFDQLMFRNDLEAKIKDNREELVVETIEKRMQVYDEDYRRISTTMDSLNRINDSLTTILMNKPVITAVSSTTSTSTTKDSLGNQKPTTTKQVNIGYVENPLNMQVKANNVQIESYHNKLNELTNQRRMVDSVVRAEFEVRPIGFMEELNASISVISQGWLGLVFYVLLFIFLMFLELFVVSIKWGEQKCDYELMVLHQLELKERQLENLKQNIVKKYLTGENTETIQKP